MNNNTSFFLSITNNMFQTAKEYYLGIVDQYEKVKMATCKKIADKEISEQVYNDIYEGLNKPLRMLELLRCAFADLDYKYKKYRDKKIEIGKYLILELTLFRTELMFDFIIKDEALLSKVNADNRPYVESTISELVKRYIMANMALPDYDKGKPFIESPYEFTWTFSQDHCYFNNAKDYWDEEEECDTMVKTIKAVMKLKENDLKAIDTIAEAVFKGEGIDL